MLLVMSETEKHGHASEDWLSPREAGQLVPGGVTGVTIRKWCQAGNIPGAVQLPSGRWVIPRSAIEHAMYIPASPGEGRER